MAIIQRSLQLTEHASARTATLRFCRIVSKVNKAYSSSGKEDFPEAGEDLFGKGFASRLKERTETAAELSEAKKWDTRIFSQTLYVFVSSWHVEGHGTRDDEEPSNQNPQTRTRPYQPRGKCYLLSPSETSSKQQPQIRP